MDIYYPSLSRQVKFRSVRSRAATCLDKPDVLSSKFSNMYVNTVFKGFIGLYFIRNICKL